MTNGLHRHDEPSSDIATLRTEYARMRDDRDAAQLAASNAEAELRAANIKLNETNAQLKAANSMLREKVVALNEAAGDLQTFIAASQIAKIFLDQNLKVRRFTQQAAEVFPLGMSDLSTPLGAVGTPSGTESFAESARRVLATGEEEEFEWRNEATKRDYLVRSLPYVDGEGVRAGVVLTFTDVTDLRDSARIIEATKADAERNLVEIEELYRTLPQALALFDNDKRYIRVNEKLATLNGASVDDHLGRRVREVVPDVAEAVEARLDHVLATGEALLNVEITGATPAAPNADRIYEVDFHPFTLRGEVVGVGVCVFDMTSERETEAEMRRMMRELQHRVKNILANVMAVINQAKRAQDDPVEAMETLSSRVEALAATHNLLSVQNWRSATLREIAEQELGQVYGADHARIEGPNVELSAKAALAIAMAFHEMATNAAKYGALSAEGGVVDLSWQHDHEALRIEWVERGGPTVTAPTAQGFGSMLVLSTLERSLSGKVEHFFEPSGLRCVVTLPAQALRVEEQETGDDDGGTERRAKDPLS